MTRAQHARFDSQIDSSSDITYRIKIKPQELRDNQIICISDAQKEVSIFNRNRANETFASFYTEILTNTQRKNVTDT